MESSSSQVDSGTLSDDGPQLLVLADLMHAETWNDHIGQTLCSPVSIGALQIVRVSTSGAVAAFGVPSSCFLVSSKAWSAWARRNDSASKSARSCTPTLRSATASASTAHGAPLPRLKMYSFCGSATRIDNCSYRPYIRDSEFTIIHDVHCFTQSTIPPPIHQSSVVPQPEVSSKSRTATVGKYG